MMKGVQLKSAIASPGKVIVSGAPEGLDGRIVGELARIADDRLVVHIARDDQRAAPGQRRHSGGPARGNAGEGEDRPQQREAHLPAVRVTGDEQIGLHLAQGEVRRVTEDDVEAVRCGDPQPRVEGIRQPETRQS